MSEFAPPGGSPRMTRAQVKAYIANMKKAQIIAKAKLEQAKVNGEFEKEAEELAQIEKELDAYFDV